MAGYIRQHWAIDVTFREDACQIYAGDGARNLCTFSRTLFNLVKENPLKDSITGKMQKRVGMVNLGLIFCLLKISAKYDPALAFCERSNGFNKKINLLFVGLIRMVFLKGS